MSSLVSAGKRLGLVVCLSAFPLLAYGQARFDLQGGEYPVTGPLQGDQVLSQLALNPFGGYLVWQDNATDGDGFGISARHINRSLSGALGGFRVNEGGTGDQTVPHLALLSNGGVAFVWQSALGGSVTVYARFLNPNGTFATGDVAVSSYTGGDQTMPAVASLKDGTVVVVWTSYGQERSGDGRPVPDGMQGVFAQRFSAAGIKLGTEFQINSTLPLNQRTPAIAALDNGNFVVAWISEAYKGSQFASDFSGRTDISAGVEIYDVVVNARIFGPTGAPISGEIPVSSSALTAANPSLVATPDGFTVTWSGRVSQPLTEKDQQDSWDIYGRLLGPDGAPRKSEFRINSYTFGDQYRPQLAFQDGIHFVLWTSLQQDGSQEGVIGRLLATSGEFMSTEFRVNTTVAGKQIFPTVVANGEHAFLTVWSSFVGGVSSFDLFAQRFSSSAEQTMAAPAAPHVSALSQTKLSVSWPELGGYPGVKYEVYVDANSAPVAVDSNSATIVSLLPDSSHTFRLAYVLADGTRSPLSSPATGKTWAEDNNFDGLPDDWQSRFFGPDSSKWPSASADSDGDGASNLQELLAGTDPTSAASVLRAQMLATDQGPRLVWNTEPGCIYQVQWQESGQAWVSLGTPRFAAGQTDSIPVDAGKSVALYRVIRVR